MHLGYPKDSLAEKKNEGYWAVFQGDRSGYPFPIPNQLTEKEAIAIFKLIKKKEGEAEVLTTRGMSPSRLEKNTLVGNEEFHHGNWLWPQGFAEHYVLKHKVKPTDDFLKFIGYEEKKSLWRKILSIFK